MPNMPEKIAVVCPDCGTWYRVDMDAIGSQGRCKCGTKFLLQVAEAPVETAGGPAGIKPDTMDSLSTWTEMPSVTRDKGEPKPNEKSRSKTIPFGVWLAIVSVAVVLFLICAYLLFGT